MKGILPGPVFWRPLYLSRNFRHGIFQQERYYAGIHNAVFVREKLAVAVGHDDFAEEIPGVSQRKMSPATFFPESRRSVPIVCTLCHSPYCGEINLVSGPLVFALRRAGHIHYSHIHLIASSDKVVVHHVFHQVRAFLLAIVESGIAETEIRCIILPEQVEIFPSLYVPPSRTLKKKGALDAVQIILNGVVGYFSP